MAEAWYRMENTFYRDAKVRKASRSFMSKGGEGVMIAGMLSVIWAKIYEKRSYYLDWDDEARLEFEEDMYSHRIDEAVAECVAAGLFDGEILKKYGVLTSRGLQERYLDNAAKNHRTVKIDERISLVGGSREVFKSRAKFCEVERSFPKSAEVSESFSKFNEVSGSCAKFDEVEKSFGKSNDVSGGCSEFCEDSLEVAGSFTKSNEVEKSFAKSNEVSGSLTKLEKVPESLTKSENSAETAENPENWSENAVLAPETDELGGSREVFQRFPKSKKVSESLTKSNKVEKSFAKSNEVAESFSKSDEVSESFPKFFEVEKSALKNKNKNKIKNKKREEEEKEKEEKKEEDFSLSLGLTDAEVNVVETWNAVFGPEDPLKRFIFGPPYCVGEMFRFNLDKAFRSGLELADFKKAFIALKESETFGNWQITAAVKPDNVRILLAEAQKKRGKESVGAPKSSWADYAATDW